MKSKIMKMVIAAFVLSAFGLMGCGSEKSEMIPGPKVTDADGNEYPTVKIGNQLWMAKNLNVKVPGSMCYDNDPANCEKFGRLYTWGAAKMACPTGWHLPSKEEIEILLDKSPRKEERDFMATTEWEGDDKFGFAALLAGNYSSREKKFDRLGGYAFFWSSTENNDSKPYYWKVSYGDLGLYTTFSAFISDDNLRAYGFSVRCLQDSNEGGEASSQPPSGTLKDSRDGQAYKTVKIGGREWMAQNLNVEVPGSMCYDNNPANCEKYGRLYTWDAAKNACPTGWHLPSKREFNAFLVNFGTTGKERSSNLRVGNWKNGMDEYGFSVLPAGLYFNDETLTAFSYLGEQTFFWSSTEDDFGLANGGAHLLGVDYGVAGIYVGDKEYGRSVRCIRN